MFIKPFPKYNRTTKQRYTVYRLCESYRLNGYIRHRTIIGLGKLEELETVEQKKLLASRIEEMITGRGNLLPLGLLDDKVEELAQRFYAVIMARGRYDVTRGNGEWETVDMSTMKDKDAREIGAEWLCKQVFDQPGIKDFLRKQNWDEESISLATTHIISRAVFPASELKTVSRIKDNSAICEMTNFDREKITKDLLYGISHKLYSIKPQLEQHLSRRTNELFDLEDKIIRSNTKNYHADINSTPVQITDNKNQPIELLKVRVDNDDDHYLWVKSQTKTVKENSMNGLLSQRFEEGIRHINTGIGIRGGTKKIDKVHERIGRLKQKYPSVHKYYDINVIDDGNGKATQVSCVHKTGEDSGTQAGIYFLRTSLNEKDEHTIWTIYNIIREIEYTFRVLKTDLYLRPIYHKTDDASMAHLHLGILAFWLVVTIRYQLKQKGIHSDWREIIRIMNTQKCVTTSITNIRNEVISIRQCTEPSLAVKKIYDTMNYKYVPFLRKKSVVAPVEISKNLESDNQNVTDS